MYNIVERTINVLVLLDQSAYIPRLKVEGFTPHRIVKKPALPSSFVDESRYSVSFVLSIWTDSKLGSLISQPQGKILRSSINRTPLRIAPSQSPIKVHQFVSGRPR